jgi:hypothetical protein
VLFVSRHPRGSPASYALLIGGGQHQATRSYGYHLAGTRPCKGAGRHYRLVVLLCFGVEYTTVEKVLEYAQEWLNGWY